jgi:hypothetical protein
LFCFLDSGLHKFVHYVPPLDVIRLFIKIMLDIKGHIQIFSVGLW